MPKAEPETAEALEHHRLLGEDASRIYWEYMGREHLSEEDLVYLRDTFAVDHKDWSEIEAIMALKADGGELPEEDLKRIKMLLGHSWHDLIGSLDPVTRAAVLATGPDRMYKPWPIFDERLWISWIGAGRHGYVRGLQGSGKSDFLCRIAEVFIRHGGTVISTIPLSAEVERYIPVIKGSDLVRTACELKGQGVDCLVLRDEAFLSVSGEAPAAIPTRRFRMMFRLFRKLGISDLSAAQYESDILRDIRREAVFRARKTSKVHRDRAHIEIEHAEIAGFQLPDGFSDYVRSIPRTSLPFNTNTIAVFQMDFDSDGLMMHLAGLPLGSNQYEAAKAWLDSQGLVVTNEYKRWFAERACGGEQPIISQTKCAQILGVEQPTISRWLSRSGA